MVTVTLTIFGAITNTLAMPLCYAC